MIILSSGDLVYGTLVSAITILYAVYVIGIELPATQGDIVASTIMMSIYLVPPLTAKLSTEFLEAIYELGKIAVSERKTGDAES